MPDNRPKTREELHQKVMRVLRIEFPSVEYTKDTRCVAYEAKDAPGEKAFAFISQVNTQKPLVTSRAISESQAAAVAIAMQLLGAGVVTPSKFQRASQELYRANLSSSVELESGILKVADLVCLIPWQGTGDYVCEYHIAYVNSDEHDAIGRALKILNDKDDQ